MCPRPKRFWRSEPKRPGRRLDTNHRGRCGETVRWVSGPLRSVAGAVNTVPFGGFWRMVKEKNHFRFPPLLVVFGQEPPVSPFVASERSVRRDARSPVRSEPCSRAPSPPRRCAEAHGLLTGCHDGCLRVFDLRSGTGGAAGSVHLVQQVKLHQQKCATFGWMGVLKDGGEVRGVGGAGGA